VREFKIMAMREGDQVTVTGYNADPQVTGTVSYWRRGGEYGASWTVGVRVAGEDRDYGYGGDRPHTFWR